MISFAILFATCLYLIGLIGGFLVPETLETGVPGPFVQSALINLGLSGLFAIQRSVFGLVTRLLSIPMAWPWRSIPMGRGSGRKGRVDSIRSQGLPKRMCLYDRLGLPEDRLQCT